MRILASMMIGLFVSAPCLASRGLELSAEYRACALDEATVTELISMSASWRPDDTVAARGAISRYNGNTAISGSVMRTGDILFIGGDFYGGFGAGLIEPGERAIVIDPYDRGETAPGGESFRPVSTGTGSRAFRGVALGWMSGGSPAVGIRGFYSLQKRWSRGRGEEPRLLRDKLFGDEGREEAVQIHDGGAAVSLFPGRDIMCEIYGLGCLVRDSRGKPVTWNVEGIGDGFRGWSGYGCLCRYDDGHVSLWTEGGMTALIPRDEAGWCRGRGLLCGGTLTHRAVRLFLQGSARDRDFYGPGAVEGRAGACVEARCEFIPLPWWRAGASVLARDRHWIPSGSAWRTVNRREEVFTSVSLPWLAGEGNMIHLRGPEYRSTRYGARGLFFPERFISPGLGMQFQERDGHWSMAVMTALSAGPKWLRMSLGGGAYRVTDGNALYGGLPWRAGVSMPGLYIMSRSGWVGAATVVLDLGDVVFQGGYGMNGGGGGARKSHMEFSGTAVF